MSDFSNVHISWRFTFFHHFLWARNIFVSWASRYFQAFFVAGYFVASLNLDLSRGQILNDAKSIKNSKPALFWVSALAQIVAKKIRPFFSFWQENNSCENWDFNFGLFFSSSFNLLNGILWDKVIWSFHHFFPTYQLLIDSSRAIKGTKRCATLIKYHIWNSHLSINTFQ